MPVGVLTEAEDRQGAPFVLAEARGLLRPADMAEPAGDGVQRIGEVAPAGRRIGSVPGELAAGPLPPAERRLRLVDLVGAHALEEVVLRIMLSNVVEAQEPPRSGAVEIGRLKRRLELAGRVAARRRAPGPRPF